MMKSTMRFLCSISCILAVLFSLNVNAACCNKNSDPSDWGHQLTKGGKHVKGFGGKLASKRSHLFSATLYPGSLKSNITRIMNASGWGRVVWKLPFDYNWVSKTNLSAPTVKQLISIVLNGYPIQAVFYDTNRVLVIEPRALHG